MNKKLIALAVAGACVAPAAMAQTANPVTLYGRVHVTFESVEASGTGAQVRRNRVNDQASLLGVRGTEDLGGGLKAFFQLETSFKPDQNDSTFANRNSGVGLQGGWGSILLGRWDTPYKQVTTAIDPFGDVTLGGYTAVMNGSGIRGQQGQFDRREQNVVQYWSPTFAGVKVMLSYMANEARTATLNPRSNGASISYTGGPVYIAYAYHEFKDIGLGTAPSTTFASLPKQTANQVAGTLAFGPVKLGAAYEEIKREGLGTTAVPGFTKRKSFLGNVVFTFGNNQLIYQYAKGKDGELTSIAAQPDCDANVFGYQYNFTRRTFFLAQYAKIENNNNNSTCNFGSTPGSISGNIGGQDPKGISLGIRHVF
jgi:predicted porin